MRRPNQYIPSLEGLLRLSPTELQQLGLACISLVCATGLPGAEDVDIAVYLARVSEWAAFVRYRLPSFAGAFLNRPEDFRNSEAFFLMSVLVQVLKLEIGLHYIPDRIPPLKSGSDTDWRTSRNLLIHGPLGPTLAGTCNNIPMAVVAVARELGYPVYLAASPFHVYAKWVEPNGYSFNIEASNPAGMVSHSDDHYREWPIRMTETLVRSGYYLRPFSVVDELALCMVSRGWALEASHRFAEATLAHAHACRLAPTEPMYPRAAACCLGRWMRETYNAGKHKEQQIKCDSMYQIQDLYMDPRRILPAQHVAMALAVQGRYFEILGKATIASRLFGESQRWHSNYGLRLGGSPRAKVCLGGDANAKKSSQSTSVIQGRLASC